MSSSDPAKEHQLILRLPKEHAREVRASMKADTLGERMQIEFHKDPLGTMRLCKLKIDDTVLSGKLMDLPAIIESHKTLDRKVLYKTGDISQMIVCSEGAEEEEELEEKGNVEEMTAARKKELYKRFLSNHGITPPLKNVRKRRFRKTKIKKIIESPEVEKEVKRLLREDAFAIKVSAFKVVNEEDKHNDDGQSIASDSISQGHLLQDEDSLLSHPDSYGGSDDKAELLRMLEEASSGSSSSEGEEEGEGEGEREDEGDSDEDEEISVVDQSPESEEVTALRVAIQNLENEIEAQKLKIASTPMPLLRNRFEAFLGELEKQRKAKIEELTQLLS